MRLTERDIELLLDAWPQLRRLPVTESQIVSVAGPLRFSMQPPGLPLIEDCYSIRIDISLGRTEFGPQVYEVGGRIPRELDNHINVGGAGSLCLGSPWSVMRKLGRPPNLVRFVDTCIVPFLYAATWREQGNEGFPFYELRHGLGGLEDDYSDILGLDGADQVEAALYALTLRPRLANRLRCPCDCGKRLGRCSFRLRLKRHRAELPRSTFRAILALLQEATSIRESRVGGQVNTAYLPEDRGRGQLPA